MMQLAAVQTLFQCLANCTSDTKQAPMLCVTPGCLDSANMFMNALDPTADPCDDFYEFACGKWVKNAWIPDGRVVWSQFSRLQESVDHKLEEVLTSPTKPASSAENMVKQLYAKCMDKKAHEDNQESVVWSQIESDLGGWPLAGSSGDNVDLTNILANSMKKLSSAPLLRLSVEPEAKSPDNYIIYFKEGHIGLPDREYFLRETGKFPKFRAAYKDFIIKTIQLLFKDMPESKSDSNQRLLPVANEEVLTQEIEDMIKFETKLAKLHRKSAEKRDEWANQNYYDLQKLTKEFPVINWKSFFESILPKDVAKMLSNDNFTVIIEPPKYFAGLTALVKQTNTKVVHNYIVWRYIQGWVKHLGKKYKELSDEFSETLSGKTSPTPRWLQCTGLAKNLMYFAAGSLYINQYFDENLKTKMSRMVEDIQEVFRKEVLKNIDWMDATTKELSIEKAKSMKRFIGYPENIKEPEEVDKKYSELVLKPEDKPIVMYQTILEWDFATSLKKLSTKHKSEYPEEFPADVNAYYLPDANALTIPAGIMGQPFYSLDTLNAINYGGMGSVIGHEITHGFDDQGSNHDISGKLRHWWSKESRSAFKKNAKCFISQYNNFNVRDLNATSYLSKRDKEEAGKALPGMEKYSDKQLFFLSYANVWCRKVTPEHALSALISDPHSPQRARVNLPLSNLDHFSKAFNCPVGSPMNPKKTTENKCKLW